MKRRGKQGDFGWATSLPLNAAKDASIRGVLLNLSLAMSFLYNHIYSRAT